MKLHDKVVLVTGVSGTVGDRISKRCLEVGARVKGLVRNKGQISICTNLGIEPIFGDLIDKEAINDALKNVNIVIHAAAYLGNDRRIARESNINGVRNLVEGSISAGVERFVHISTVSVYGHLEGDVELDEASELAYGHSEVYISSKCESERILQDGIKKGLKCVILRPGVICAEHNSHWGDRLIEKIRAIDNVTWIHPEDLTPWIHSDNLAEMCVLAATHPAAINQIFNAVDGNYQENDFTVRIARSMNKTLTIPDGNPIRMVYTFNKIRNELGYIPIRKFDETVLHLAKQAQMM